MSTQAISITRTGNAELWRAASRLVADTSLAVLTTADGSGMPHACWMNVLAEASMKEVVTITAPDTQKVANLRDNPRAEWMFASPTMETIVYLSGPAEIMDADEARGYWVRMPGKTKAYFRHYCATDDHTRFTIVRTRVTKIVYCRPVGYRKAVVQEVPA